MFEATNPSYFRPNFQADLVRHSSVIMRCQRRVSSDLPHPKYDNIGALDNPESIQWEPSPLYAILRELLGDAQARSFSTVSMRGSESGVQPYFSLPDTFRGQVDARKDHVHNVLR